jgi:hypothetical protein
MTDEPNQPQQPPAVPPTDAMPAVPPAPAGLATPNKFEMLLKSRKFWAALVGLALIITKAYRPDIPIQEDQLAGIIVVLVGYILGTAVEDSAHPIPPKAG